MIDIAVKSDFAKGTVNLIFGTLESRRFVHQDLDTKEYGLGIRAFVMGSAVKKGEILKEAM